MITPDLNAVVPYFQPIIRSSDQSVFAYEVLARERHDGKIRSLGPYFEDPTVSDEDKLTLDVCVRERALEAYAASDCKGKLFINLQPSWVYADKDKNNQQAILTMLDRYKVDPQNIVIEVTEEELQGDSDEFGKLLTTYRKAGCLLAVDDFGKGESSVERIAYVMPDIIKIDHSIVRKTDTHTAFYEICSALSLFGDISGFDLLFEGVETAYQLERCIKNGWCYLQGYVFSPARAGFETDYANRDLLSDILTVTDIKADIYQELREQIFNEMKTLVNHLRPLIPLDERALQAPDALVDFAKLLPYYCIRCFICDHKGKRLSPLYSLAGNGTARPLEKTLINISYIVFNQGMSVLHGGSNAYLSDVYKNVATKEDIITYMHELYADRYLCVDIISTVLL